MHTKSEEYGISVMDSGVALITLNAGISSRKARPWFHAQNRQPMLKELFTTLKQSVFPIAIGFFRIVLLSKLDYQEHSSEYGIHWNFYTTIALINIMLVFVRSASVAMPLAFGLMISYEFLLSEYALDKFIFHAPRVDFVSANREGIASLVGYFSLELIGIGLGNFMYT